MYSWILSDTYIETQYMIYWSGLFDGLWVIIIYSSVLTYYNVSCYAAITMYFFDLQTEYDETALRLAAENGHLNVVRFLKEGGAAIDTQDKVGCPTIFVGAYFL